MKLLIVEDDPGLIKALEEAATEIGDIVAAEQDGLTRLNRAQSKTFDLILLDVMLPSIDGGTFSRRARLVQIVTPILIMTAGDALKELLNHVCGLRLTICRVVANTNGWGLSLRRDDGVRAMARFEGASAA